MIFSETGKNKKIQLKKEKDKIRVEVSCKPR